MGIIGSAFLGVTRVFGGGDDRFISATGGTITYDGDYAIHTFTETGSATFTINNLSTAANNIYDLLVVGGGGGGCSSPTAGGGGGGGQVVYSQSLEFTRTGDFDIFVGDGGDANDEKYQEGATTPAAGTLRAYPGQTSSFDNTIIAFRGGPGNAGGIWPSSSAHALTEQVANGGGSGFGAGAGEYPSEYPLKVGAYGTINNGGNYIASNLVAGASNQSGGGGGASDNAAGGNGTWGLPVPGGDGADGTAVSITGTSVYYGGGGGGGRNSNGGLGGGGDSNSTDGDPGVANTGGGGGGSGNDFTFGTKGGSGVVIVRYKYK